MKYVMCSCLLLTICDIIMIKTKWKMEILCFGYLYGEIGSFCYHEKKTGMKKLWVDKIKIFVEKTYLIAQFSISFYIIQSTVFTFNSFAASK